jgi:hypothetical protein
MANIGEVAADVPGVLSTTMPAMAPAFWIRLACYTGLEWLANKRLVRSYPVAPLFKISAFNPGMGCTIFTLPETVITSIITNSM